MDLRQALRATIYDRAIVPLTTGWYRAVIERWPNDAQVLDVGIGTGAALLANLAAIRTKRIHVLGIDIDADYVTQCRAACAAHAAQGNVEVKLESVYDHQGGPYDAIYFSASFMLLPDPQAALRHVAGLLSPTGRIFFTQTFERHRSAFVDLIKPLLRFVTTIDFGTVTYQQDFESVLAACGVTIDERFLLNESPQRFGMLVVARPN